MPRSAGRSPGASVLAVALWVATMSLAGMAFGASAPQEGSASAESGEALFMGKCSSCHTIGGGKRVGPDLAGVTSRRDRDWLTRFISAPDRVIAGGDAVASELLKEFKVPMPNLGLAPAQVGAIVAFLAAPAESAHPHPGTAAPASPPAQVPPPGNPRTGEALFGGRIPFRNGGAPCVACHNVSGAAPLGGGTLGPDLTAVYTRFGEAGISSVLATLPFPTMKPIFDSRPLTPEEREDLKAFFRQSAGRPPGTPRAAIGALAAGGWIVLLLLAQATWRGRLRGVRRKLPTNAAGTGGGGE
ncbi:MAG: c-type cytochrome [Actinomycetota bacterium]